MQPQFKFAFDGQSVQTEDLETIAQAALAEDRTLATLYPMAAAPTGRGVIPITTSPLLAPGTAGHVAVGPMRAVIGSRSTDPLDIRSGVTPATSLAIGANASGNPRWDLVYATVTPDAPTTPTVPRKVKDTTTAVVTSQNVSTTIETKVSLQVLAGTPSATPTWPAVPADPAGSYNIAIGYVLVPTAFGTGDAVLATNIATTAPVVTPSAASGSRSGVIPDQSYVLSAAEQTAWATGGRPTRYLPSSMTGGVRMPVVLSLFTGAMSHTDGQVIDSRDWRGRMSTFIVMARASDFVMKPGGSGTMPDANTAPGFATNNTDLSSGVGQTIKPSSGKSTVAAASGLLLFSVADGASVSLYVDHADGGKLKVQIVGAPNCALLFFVDFTGAFDNVA